MQQAEDVVLRELRTAFEEIELHGEAEAGDFAAKLPHQLHRRLHRPAGGEQVVDDDHALPRLDRVEVNLQRVGAVLQVVADARGLRRQLLGLAYRHEARVQPVRQRRAEDEPARLDTEHQVDLLADVVRRQRVGQLCEALLVLQQRGDVVEQNARLGKIRNGADKVLQRFTVDLFPQLHYHAPSISNVFNAAPSLSASWCSTTWSTRLPREPLASANCRSSNWSGSPAASTSTSPSAVLRTQPRSPISAASRCTNQRNPTPCTRPLTRKCCTIICYWI